MNDNIKQPRLAVLGSINMDLVIRCRRLSRPGETLLADDAREVPGGKGANQAVAAARLGAQVAMIGRVGSDGFASSLLANLRAENVDTGAVVSTPDCPSGLAVVSVDSGGENSITVVPGANGRVTPADVESAADVIRNADVLLLQLETPVEAVLAGIHIARAAGTRVILDPAPAPTNLPAGLLNVDALCPNESEAAAILGCEIDSIDAARSAVLDLQGFGAANAIITLGANGAIFCDSSGHVQHVPTAKVDAVDTTAAGDAFAAALGVFWAEGRSFAEAVQSACFAGALVASRHGAQVAMPTRDEIAVLIAKTPKHIEFS